MSQPIVFAPSNEKCASPACLRTNLAKACTRRLCAKCCRVFSTPCGYSGHQAKRIQQHTAHVAAAAARQAYAYAPQLARPPPIRRPLDTVQDLLPPPVSSPLITQDDAGAPLLDMVEGSVQERLFQKEMYPAFRVVWDSEKKAQAENARVQQQRRENEAALLHSIEMLFWREDSKPPERYTVQGIKTWPTFVIQQSPSACTFLNLAEGDLLDVYSLSALTWQAHALGAVFSVQANQLLLLRRRGLASCPELDQAIAEARQRTQRRGTALSPLQVTLVLPKSSAKRAREPGSDIDSGQASSMPRLGVAHTSPFSTSPALQIPQNPTRPYLQDVQAYRSPPPQIASSRSDSGSLVASPPPSSSPSHDGSTSSNEGSIPATYYGLGLGLDLSVPSPTNTAPQSLVAPSLDCFDFGAAFQQSTHRMVSPQHIPDLHPSSPSISPSFHPSPAGSAHSCTIPSSTASISRPPPSSHASTARDLDSMYACDVARGFARIAANSAQDRNLAQRFQGAFPGAAFSTTAYRHYNAWRLSKEEEREKAEVAEMIQWIDETRHLFSKPPSSPSPSLSSPSSPYMIIFPPLPHISSTSTGSALLPAVASSSAAIHKTNVLKRPRAPTPPGTIDLTLSTPVRGKRPRLATPPGMVDLTLDSSPLPQASLGSAARLSKRARGKRPQHPRLPTPPGTIDLTVDSPAREARHAPLA
ncbi:hypothetical protein LXA43DRAFT_1094096 [Ganoderma leucocontextum]|nr:hypothetical protein LXA43DRAFT_1094096 [Ganoderma leucocontextum]